MIEYIGMCFDTCYHKEAMNNIKLIPEYVTGKLVNES